MRVGALYPTVWRTVITGAAAFSDSLAYQGKRHRIPPGHTVSNTYPQVGKTL